MYIACLRFIHNQKVSVYLHADFLTGNPFGDYVARQHTQNVVHHLQKNPNTRVKYD
jgi:hypothetical protein